MIGAGAGAAAGPPGIPAAVACDPAGAPVGDAGATGLDAEFLAAHARNDRTALVGLYARAAAGAGGMARAFYLTQAYVFALEAGDPRAAALKADLVALGADTA